ncbi:MAG: NYN domain-containing protein [Patescibacteria group bacterium]
MAALLFIDGENFKGKIRSVFKGAGKQRPAWYQYDFNALLNKVLGGIEADRRVFYFARIKEHAQSMEKSKQLIEEQRLLKRHLEQQGFEVILSGRVRAHIEENKNTGGILIFREKGVDVRIAVDMMNAACDKKADTIILGSSDSDLQPAIKEIRERGIACVYLGFETQPNKGISYTTNRTILIRNSEVLEHEKEI